MTDLNEKLPEEEQVACLTTKEIKALARPEFRADPDKFQPTALLRKLGFERQLCRKCDGFFWMHDSCAEDLKASPICGDSNCLERQTFINRGTGIGHVDSRPEGFKQTQSQCWKDFSAAMLSSRIPVTPIEKQPTVARWRSDVDFTAAGIYCFQPFCVTGELEPPENPLCCPQFCVRFNDLDNIGLTGRHQSGFIMLGIQCFNLPHNFIMFKEECVEFNLRWLTEQLKIPKSEIFLREDVWAGGGNLGACMEYFIGGLEVGNMVFMQQKTFPDGSREELKVKVIDVGIGMERVPWLINGTPTSQCDVFEDALGYLNGKLQLDIHNDIWTKFGPLSSQLDIDECADINKTWEDIAKVVNSDVVSVKKGIQPIKDMYIILDHTRSVLMLVTDGALPSSKGGGYNIRNILRRCFEKLLSNKLGEQTWWDVIGGLDGFLEIFEFHKRDLAKVQGPFKRYDSFRDIIAIELERYKSLDIMHEEKLKKLIKKRENKLTIDDWILCMKTYGIPADKISSISGLDIPNNLQYEIALREERFTRPTEQVLQDTSDLPATDMLYLTEPDSHSFSGKVVAVLNDLSKPLPQPRNVLILDRTSFYPTSGGQNCDKGTITVNGKLYNVVNCEKVGHCVMHVLDQELPVEVDTGVTVSGSIDSHLRNQLKAHHTGTHIIFSACRQVLGPHVWQHGAHKSEEQAHIDITHYSSISQEQERAIENFANRVVNANSKITKTFHNKKEAELKWGFDLYQGGAIPSTSIRVVEIEGIDTEACCGTHCESTGEVGWIRMLKTSRISDGIVRLYQVCYERSIERLNTESDTLHNLCDIYGVSQQDLVTTGTRVFKDMKHQSEKVKKGDKKIMDLQVRLALSNEKLVSVLQSDQTNATLQFKFLKGFAQDMQTRKRGIILQNDNFIQGLLGEETLLDWKVLCELVEVDPKTVKQTNKVAFVDKERKINFKVSGVSEFGIVNTKKVPFDLTKFLEFVKQQDFYLMTD